MLDDVMDSVLCYSLSNSFKTAPFNREIKKLQRRTLLFFTLQKIVVVKIYFSELTCLLPFKKKQVISYQVDTFKSFL